MNKIGKNLTIIGCIAGLAINGVAILHHTAEQKKFYKSVEEDCEKRRQILEDCINRRMKKQTETEA